MRLSALLLLLAASACSTGSGPEAVCDREANNDPTVRQILTRQAGSAYVASETMDELNYQRGQAKRACLRRLGVLPPGSGGVEPVRRPNAAYRGLL